MLNHLKKAKSNMATKVKSTKINLGEFRTNPEMAIKFATSLFKNYMVGSESGFIKKTDFELIGRTLVLNAKIPNGFKFNGNIRKPEFIKVSPTKNNTKKFTSKIEVIPYDTFMKNNPNLKFVTFVPSDGCKLDDDQRKFLSEKYMISREGYLYNKLNGNVNSPYLHKSDNATHNTFVITKSESVEYGITKARCDTSTSCLINASF